MSDSCFIRSISKVSCCLVLSTSSWVCWVTDSIFTVSALCQHINTLDVTTHSQMLTSNLKPTPLDWSAVCVYLPKQLSMAAHQLCVLLLQLIVPLFSGLCPFCTDKTKEKDLFIYLFFTFSLMITVCKSVRVLTVTLTFSLDEGGL